MINTRAIKRLETKLKRQSQKCQVFEIKLDNSRLSKKGLNHLIEIFLEAKWYYNYILSNKNINDAETKIKQVPVKVGEDYETRDLDVLTAQMRQDIKARTFGSLKALKQLKKNGHKVGWLKFKKRITSIPLRQLGRTFDLDFDNSKIRIQGLKGWIKARGLNQITKDKEIANATLTKKPSGFYLNVTTFENKVEQDIPDKAIGIDFGCETQLTFSDGTKVEFQVPVSKQIKRLSRKIDKKVNGKTGKNRGSKNRRKLQWKRRKTHEHLNNKKKDIRNKVVNTITKNFKIVVFQDESISEWKKDHHGKKVQNSGIGGILADLKNKSATPIVVDKWFPSTQLCPDCGSLNKLKQSDRIYKCKCGFVEDRDIKSARCILDEGLKIPTDHRESEYFDTRKPGEMKSSTFFDTMNNIHGITVSTISSVSQEAPPLAAG